MKRETLLGVSMFQSLYQVHLHDYEDISVCGEVWSIEY